MQKEHAQSSSSVPANPASPMMETPSTPTGSSSSMPDQPSQLTGAFSVPEAEKSTSDHLSIGFIDASKAQIGDGAIMHEHNYTGSGDRRPIITKGEDEKKKTTQIGKIKSSEFQAGNYVVMDRHIQQNEGPKESVGLRDRDRSYNKSDGTKKRYERKGRKGYLLILEFFSKERTGNEQDVRSLEHFFKQSVDFDVVRYTDLTYSELADHLTIAKRKLNREKYYSFACAVMSHGNKEGIYTQDYRLIKVEFIINYFDNRSVPEFAGLPKVFFIQACRGGLPLQSITVQDSEPDEPELITIPVKSDVLVAYATVKGSAAQRNHDVGSWFIQTLMAVLRDRHLDEHLEEMLIEVRANVAETLETLSGGKQMPCVWTSLRRRLYLSI